MRHPEIERMVQEQTDQDRRHAALRRAHIARLKVPFQETCARLGVFFGAFCGLWLSIVRRGGAVWRLCGWRSIARICQAAARIREQRLIL